MRLRVLGCSGGIGRGLRTTSMLLDGDVLIDAGTGVGDLTHDEMRRIDHIFVSHSHLDHVACIPFLLDTVGGLRDVPVVVHAREETIAVLREHLFNGKLWPDFSRLPKEEAPFLRFEAIAEGQAVDLAGRRIVALPANHVVPALGYLLDSGAGSLAFSGDSGECPAFWAALEAVENLRYLVMETTFCNAERDLALVSRHYFPGLLAQQLPRLKQAAEVYITHLEPFEQQRIMTEIAAEVRGVIPKRLNHGHIFEF